MGDNSTVITFDSDSENEMPRKKISVMQEDQLALARIKAVQSRKKNQLRNLEEKCLSVKLALGQIDKRHTERLVQGMIAEQKSICNQLMEVLLQKITPEFKTISDEMKAMRTELREIRALTKNRLRKPINDSASTVSSVSNLSDISSTATLGVYDTRKSMDKKIR